MSNKNLPKKLGNKKKKIDFKHKKENIICSLFEVESFLDKACCISYYVKLYNMLK